MLIYHDVDSFHMLILLFAVCNHKLLHLCHVCSSDHVVHTYAAHAIERLLTVREDDGTLRVDSSFLAPHLQTLFISLFSVLESKDDSSENEYVARAIMRVCITAKGTSAPFVQVLLEKVKQLVIKVSSNPTNPQFNHYLFEIIACLISNICPSTPAAVSAFEQSLFPVFEQMLKSSTCDEFQPYVFQILALLLEFFQGTTLSQAYQGIFPALLAPSMWQNLGNAPALVRLISAFISKAPSIVEAKLPGVLGVFQKLNAAVRTESFGGSLIFNIYANLPIEIYSKFLPDILKLQFARLQSLKQAKGNDFITYPSALIPTWAAFAVKQGVPRLMQVMDEVQQGMFYMALEKVWLANSAQVYGSANKRACALALAQLVSGKYLLTQQHSHLWVKALDAALSMIELRVRSIDLYNTWLFA
jgi:exportin-2 (importin alpha re-exporter)